MDKFDRQIIALLSQDARQSNAEVARKINLSRSAVVQRIHKLEEQGVITGYRACVSRPKQMVATFLEINHQLNSCENLMPEISAIPEVISCHAVAGDVDMIVYVEANTMQTLDDVRNYIHNLDVVTRVVSRAVYKELLRR